MPEAQIIRAWEPSPEQLRRIRGLAKLGHNVQSISEELRVGVGTLTKALTSDDHPAREAYDLGIAEQGRYARMSTKTWRPDEAELEQIEHLARKGYSKSAIAGKLDIARTTFIAACDRIPEVLTAYERGLAEHDAWLNDKATELINAGDRSAATLIVWKEKSMHDRVEPVRQMGELKVSVSPMVIKKPKQVDDDDFVGFAEREMKKLPHYQVQDVTPIVETQTTE
jgi:hypothetical protein